MRTYHPKTNRRWGRLVASMRAILPRLREWTADDLARCMAEPRDRMVAMLKYLELRGEVRRIRPGRRGNPNGRPLVDVAAHYAMVNP